MKKEPHQSLQPTPTRRGWLISKVGQKLLAMMKKTVPAANPDAYVAGLGGWRLECVVALRADVRAAARLSEAIKWGHLVYSANGPVLLIRAEEHRVLFGFWRGQTTAGDRTAIEAGRKV